MAMDSRRDSKRPVRSRRDAVRSPWSAMPLVAACSVLVAGCMLAGTYAQAAFDNAASSVSESAEPEPMHEPSSDPVETKDGQELIGSYRAISQSTDERRAVNVSLAAEAIDGVVIQSGETFSFNDTVGDTEHDERYLMAPIISDDEVIDGRGGGICQVSTALYIAALTAGLDVVERHAHTLVSDYAPVGLDATLAYGLLDLKIRNTTGHPVEIDARALGQSVDVAFYGVAPSDGATYDAVSKVIDRFVVSESEAQQSSLSAGTYYVAEAYVVSYVDGVMTGSQLLSTNTYKAGESEAVKLGEGSVDPTK